MLVRAAAREERLLRVLVELALHQALERRNRLELHRCALHARGLLDLREGLRQEALNTTRDHDLLVALEQLF